MTHSRNWVQQTVNQVIDARLEEIVHIAGRDEFSDPVVQDRYNLMHNMLVLMKPSMEIAMERAVFGPSESAANTGSKSKECYLPITSHALRARIKCSRDQVETDLEKLIKKSYDEQYPERAQQIATAILQRVFDDKLTEAVVGKWSQLNETRAKSAAR